MASRLHRVLRFGEDHPVLTVVVVAVAVRLVVAIVSFVLNPEYLIPDELQYVQLARTVSEGHTAESWFPQFGQSLYDSTWAFTAPIRFLFDVLWPTRLLGQLYAVVFGALTAALTVVLARQVVRTRLAVLAGLLVALLPSQVLWSSVVLRESLVWAALALVAVGFTGTFRGRREVLLGAAAIVVGLLLMSATRDQTMLAAAWALPLSAVIARGPRFLPRLAGCVLLAVFVPILAGAGPGGWHLLQERFPALATTRLNLGLEANSSFTPTTLLPTTVPPSGSSSGSRPRGSGRPVPSTVPSTVPLSGGGVGQVVRSPSGAMYVVDESARANLRAIPRGIVAVVLRPFPWEGGSFTLRLAGAEDPLWYVLYVVAAYGLWSFRRRLDVLAMPVVLAGGAMAAEVLIQGNVGTAFRHRGQVLWVLALLAACGVEAWVRRREGDGEPAGAASDLDGVGMVTEPASR